MWDEITYPFPSFNGAAVEVWELIVNFISIYCAHDNVSMLGFKLTHWGRVRHICVGNPTIIGSDNGLSPGRRQAIIWTNAGTPGNNLQWNLNLNSYIFIRENAFQIVVWKMAAILSLPQCVNDVHWPACIIMISADVLGPTRHQVISNQHANLTVIIVSYELQYMLWVSNCMR